MSTIGFTRAASGHVQAGDVELWYEQRGEGPDVLLLGGLSDPAESWELQLAGLSDRYRLTAFDNRGAGRSAEIPEEFTVANMADDAAALMRALGIESAHVAGFSGGSLTGQELALRHPELVRSLVLQSTWGRLDTYRRTAFEFWSWMADAAPTERAMLEAFFLWVYTPRAHDDGTVAQIVEDALAFPHPQSAESFKRQIRTWTTHETIHRVHNIAVPTLVVAGGRDLIAPPELGKEIADRIPSAEYVLLAEEAHQPFQEQPDEWNAMVHEFWIRIDIGHRST
jgi:pimeloyl-ACP methyl ester carboxylesterase